MSYDISYILDTKAGWVEITALEIIQSAAKPKDGYSQFII